MQPRPVTSRGKCRVRREHTDREGVKNMRYLVLGTPRPGTPRETPVIIDETDNRERATISAMSSTNTHTDVIIVDSTGEIIERF